MKKRYIQYYEFDWYDENGQTIAEWLTEKANEDYDFVTILERDGSRRITCLFKSDIGPR